MNFSFTYETGIGEVRNVTSGLVFATAREAAAAGSACLDADDTDDCLVDCVEVVRTDRAVNCVFTGERYLAEVDRDLARGEFRLDQIRSG